MFAILRMESFPVDLLLWHWLFFPLLFGDHLWSAFVDPIKAEKSKKDVKGYPISEPNGMRWIIF